MQGNCCFLPSRCESFWFQEESSGQRILLWLSSIQQTIFSCGHGFCLYLLKLAPFFCTSILLETGCSFSVHLYLLKLAALFLYICTSWNWLLLFCTSVLVATGCIFSVHLYSLQLAALFLYVCTSWNWLFSPGLVANISDVSVPLEVTDDLNSMVFYLCFCAQSDRGAGTVMGEQYDVGWCSLQCVWGVVVLGVVVLGHQGLAGIHVVADHVVCEKTAGRDQSHWWVIYVEQEQAQPKDGTLWDTRFHWHECNLEPLMKLPVFTASEKVFDPSVDSSRYAILWEFMDQKAVAHFIKCLREVHD